MIEISCSLNECIENQNGKCLCNRPVTINPGPICQQFSKERTVVGLYEQHMQEMGWDKEQLSKTPITKAWRKHMGIK